MHTHTHTCINLHANTHVCKLAHIWMPAYGMDTCSVMHTIFHVIYLCSFHNSAMNPHAHTHDIPSTVGPEAWVERQSNGASTEVRIFKGILKGLHIACTVTRWRLASQKTQMHPILNTILTKAVSSSSTNKTTHPTHTLSQQYCPAIAHKCIWFRAAIYLYGI